MPDEPEITVDLSTLRVPNALPLLIERARAINAYASIETALSTLLAQLLGTDDESAAIVFFRLPNARSRNAIIEALLKKRHQATYDIYWNGVPKTADNRGLFDLIRELDQRRNEIIHWHTSNYIRIEDGGVVAEAQLTPPNFWTRSDHPRLTDNDLRAFSAKADFVSRSVVMFYAVTSGGDSEPRLSDNMARNMSATVCLSAAR